MLNIIIIIIIINIENVEKYTQTSPVLVKSWVVFSGLPQISITFADVLLRIKY